MIAHVVLFTPRASLTADPNVNKGVSCVECHGRIDKMEQVWQDKPLSMAFCLDCHRDPVPRLRPEVRRGKFSGGKTVSGFSGWEGEGSQGDSEFCRCFQGLG